MYSEIKPFTASFVPRLRLGRLPICRAASRFVRLISGSLLQTAIPSQNTAIPSKNPPLAALTMLSDMGKNGSNGEPIH